MPERGQQLDSIEMPIDFIQTSEALDYGQAHAMMKSYVSEVLSGERKPLIWFLEHKPVYTAGTSAKVEDLLDAEAFPVYKIERGGQFTYHGPGQRIAYLILNLKELHHDKPDIRKFVLQLEGAIINALAAFGVSAFARRDRVGIWVPGKDCEEKIAMIGIRLHKYITYHGIAINISPNLEHFKGIVPCGIKNYGLTSLEKQIYVDDEVKRQFDEQLLKNLLHSLQ